MDRVRAILDARKISLAAYVAPARPRLSNAFRQVGNTGNSRQNGDTFRGPGTTSVLIQPITGRWSHSHRRTPGPSSQDMGR